MADERLPAEAFSPGEIIQDEIDARGWTQDDLASITGIHAANINKIIKGKLGISVDTAQKFEAAFGVSAEFFMNLETAWRLHQARQSDDGSSEEIQHRARVYDAVPVREMIRRGWIKQGKNSEETEKNVAAHFGVDTIDEITGCGVRMAARASERGEDSPVTPTQLAWGCRCRQVATLVDARSFSKRKLEEAMPTLIAHSITPDGVSQVPRILAEAGVRLVVVEHLKGTKIDGAALYRNTRKEPIVALSLRYGRLDNFWHTLIHELEHILRGDLNRIESEVGMSGDEVDEIEREVDEAAANRLIPRRDMESFIRRTTPLYDTRKVKAFAKRMGVHPSIVAGQLRYRGELDWTKLTGLNVDVREQVKRAAMKDGWNSPAPV